MEATATHVQCVDGKITISKIIDTFKQNYPKAKEYQGYIDNLGPGEIDFGNGDTRPVYHPCDRQRNEQALDDIDDFHKRNGIRTAKEHRQHRRTIRKK